MCIRDRVNAVWDLYAKMEKKPLWELIYDMSPEALVDCIDFTYITDAISKEEAFQILKKKEAGKDLAQFSNIVQDADEQAKDEIARKDGPLVSEPETTGGDQPGVPASMKKQEQKNESEFIQRLKTLSGQN